MESTQAEWHPTQDTQQKHIDLRYAALGQGKGIKPSRKRKLADAEPVAEGPMDMEEDVVAAAEPDMASKRQRLDGESYRKVSGKVWKTPGRKAGTDKACILGTSWEKKMADKALRRQLQQQKHAAQEAIKEKRKAIGQQRRQAKERKTAAQQKSAVVQKISNAATVKKMMKSKKQRKLLKTADTN
eukprot:jgi/Chrzof1/7439/Cz02g24030.t1